MKTSSLKLKIRPDINTSDLANYTPNSWPPPADFPVVIDNDGKIISRYGDAFWDISIWAGKTCKIAFKRLNKSKKIDLSKENAELLRQVMAWWLWGIHGVTAANTLKAIYGPLKDIFILATENNILATELPRFPLVAEQLVNRVAPSQAEQLISRLHVMLNNKDNLGFVIADKSMLTRLASAMPDHKRYQTPYIPPRIWTYQVRRLREFIDDFNTHQESITTCFRYCLNAYIENYGSLEAFDAARSKSISITNRKRSPFNEGTRSVAQAKYHGSFRHIAEKFGIYELLRKWCAEPSIGDKDIDIRALSNYFRQLTIVGTIYILNFSFMRIEEALDLKTDCLEVDNDENFGQIYLLRGETTKTIQDSDALWVTSPVVKSAICCR